MPDASATLKKTKKSLGPGRPTPPGRLPSGGRIRTKKRVVRLRLQPSPDPYPSIKNRTPRHRKNPQPQPHHTAHRRTVSDLTATPPHSVQPTRKAARRLRTERKNARFRPKTADRHCTLTQLTATQRLAGTFNARNSPLVITKGYSTQHLFFPIQQNMY